MHIHFEADNNKKRFAPWKSSINYIYIYVIIPHSRPTVIRIEIRFTTRGVPKLTP